MEKASSTAIVPTVADLGEYLIEVKEFDASGKTTKFATHLPTVADFRQWTLVQQVVMLKRGMWNKCSVADIYWGLAYAHSIDADPMKGELFPTGEGRWGTSNKYKIRQALKTGLIEGIESEIRDTGETIQLAGCVQKTDLECTVTIHVKGFIKPIVRRAKLSRWYKSNNPNWVGNPEHMLELNTTAHACEYVHPTATEIDELSPTVTPSDVGATPESK